MNQLNTAQLIEVRGKRLHVEMDGAADLPALVYLHGGPGASCYDFVQFQMKRLAKHFHVIAFDQRGVLRSDPILADEPFGMDDLVEDCEALRIALDIKSWSVLGHSFGGHLGVRYAVAYPKSIDCLILECPSFDFDLSLRSHLRALGLEFLKMDDRAHAIQALAAANGTQDGRGTFDVFQTLVDGLGSERWEAMHIHGPEKGVFPRLAQEADFQDEQWGRAAMHFSGLLRDGKIYESIIPLLSAITQPSLLIKGKFDLVTCDKQLLAYLQNVTNGEVAMFEHSGHFPRIEEPELYEDVVRRFVYKHVSVGRVSAMQVT
ncbi:alpha/beta fold hydrolase [Alicyclobacillus fodiniaquatilis]|uniref:Alpha/beta fold hydrolase n=1 Tax=Alicyclobacillus fodiniaquatilis TaxID=1661150 RepID=A0ABW4JMB3_9BACL